MELYWVNIAGDVHRILFRSVGGLLVKYGRLPILQSSITIKFERPKIKIIILKLHTRERERDRQTDRQSAPIGVIR